MTREEAKSNIRILLEIGGSDGFDYKEREALDMAITELEQEPCDDAISRQAVLDLPKNTERGFGGKILEQSINIEYIKALPPVKPAEKVGEWTTTITPLGKCCICSECGSCPPIEYRFCPYCGAKMQEVEE